MGDGGFHTSPGPCPEEEEEVLLAPGGLLPWQQGGDLGGAAYQLPLLGREGGGRRQVLRVGAAEGVVEAVHLHEQLVLLLVDVLVLRRLVEHGRLRLRVVLEQLHVGQHCGQRAAALVLALRGELQEDPLSQQRGSETTLRDMGGTRVANGHQEGAPQLWALGDKDMSVQVH